MNITIASRKIKSLLRQDTWFLIWFAPVWLMLGFARLAILLLSFKRLARWLGVHDGLAPRTPISTPQEEVRAMAIRNVIAIASRYTPWVSNCFPQAITARVMLGLYNIPYALFFGVRREAGVEQISAHAWVVSGKVYVSGGRSFQGYSTVGCFVSRQE